MRSKPLAATSLAVALPAFAHGEQLLVYPGSLALLLFLAVVIVLLPWHKWWARIVTAVVLLASNVALWLLPSLAELSARNLAAAVLILLVVPIAVTAAAAAAIVNVAPPGDVH